MPVPPGTRVLVLGDDYVPINIVGWKKAMKRLFESPCERCQRYGRILINGKPQECPRCNGTGLLPAAVPVEYFHDCRYVRDGRGNEHLIPAVIANTHHIVRKHRKVPFSKHNVLRRDGFRCQYCGQTFPAQDLSYDHVIPRSMWNGSTTPTCWQNIVTACLKCNRKKADRTPEQAGMPLIKLVSGRWVEYKKPKTPNSQELLLGLAYRNIPTEWEPYVAYLRDKS
jgi:5-methylcytosine-specific restriction endonuclease McrA